MQQKLKNKTKSQYVICTKHLIIAIKQCPMCKEKKRKVKDGF